MNQVEENIVEFGLGTLGPFHQTGADQEVQKPREEKREQNVDRRCDVLPKRIAKDWLLERLDPVETEGQPSLVFVADFACYGGFSLAGARRGLFDGSRGKIGAGGTGLGHRPNRPQEPSGADRHISMQADVKSQLHRRGN